MHFFQALRNKFVNTDSFCFFFSKSADRYHWVEKCLNRIAMCLEKLRMLVWERLEGLCMYMHYWRVGTIPT